MDGLTVWLHAQLDADEQQIRDARALLEDHTRATACYEDQDGMRLVELPQLREAVLRIAARYADRPGYRDEWRLADQQQIR